LANKTVVRERGIDVRENHLTIEVRTIEGQIGAKIMLQLGLGFKVPSLKVKRQINQADKHRHLN